MLLLSTSKLFTAASVSALGGAAIAAAFSNKRSLDVFCDDRYFVLTYAEIFLGLAVLFGVSAAVYAAFPRLFHRRMSEGLGKVHFCLSVACAALVLTLALSGLIQKGSLTFLVAFYLAVVTLAASPILLLANLFWSLGKLLFGAQRS